MTNTIKEQLERFEKEGWKIRVETDEENPYFVYVYKPTYEIIVTNKSNYDKYKNLQSYNIGKYLCSDQTLVANLRK